MAVITISRHEGSQGEALARLVGDKLGFVVVDRAAMIAAAREQGVDIDKAPVPEIDEKKPSFWERLVEQRHHYNLLLRYLVYDHAEHDNCIILGHGADVFLAGLSHVLRLKVAAPFEIRVRRLMERDRIGREAAINLVRQSDRERGAFVKYLFQVDWMNHELYDLVINTEKLQLSTLADMIAQVSQSNDLAATPTSRQLLSDRALSCRVEMRLFADPRIGARGLRVTASRGDVTISGTVATEEEREITEEVIKGTRGISRLHSELIVVPITATLYP